MILLQISGSADCDPSNITANELMKWRLANLWKDDHEREYGVWHRHQLVSNFPLYDTGGNECPTHQPNFFEKAFPCLYPCGQGGPESGQLVPLNFPKHIQWSLQYCDCWFCKHEMFPFITFGISQHWQALTSSQIQMKHRTFEWEAHTIATITAEKLDQIH